VREGHYEKFEREYNRFDPLAFRPSRLPVSLLARFSLVTPAG